MIATILSASLVAFDCQTAVCMLDSYCCDVEWDLICNMTAYWNCPCRADFTADGKVDGQDLAVLLSNWSAQNTIADIEVDGFVNGADLCALLNSWGNCE